MYERNQRIMTTLSEIHKRLDSLSKLEYGWYDNANKNNPIGNPIISSAVNTAYTIASKLVKYDDNIGDSRFSDFELFPTSEGGIQLSWNHLNGEIDFNADNCINFYNYNTNTVIRLVLPVDTVNEDEKIKSDTNNISVSSYDELFSYIMRLK